MGELILCKKPIAADAYYIEEAMLNIYSIEEMCYYISHNVYMIDSGFASVELCNWIGKEVGRTEEKALTMVLDEKRPLHEFIDTLLRFSDYLPSDEIKSIVETIASFENKSPASCSKLRADRLLDKSRIVDAIYEYENILDMKDESITKEFLGDVWHNLGVCYVRLYFFREASVCFEYAYQQSRKKISLEAMLCAYACMDDEEGYDMQLAKYFVPEDLAIKIKKIVSDTMSSKDTMGFFGRLDKMKGEFRDEKSYRKQLRLIIERWKSEYNKLCNI